MKTSQKRAIWYKVRAKELEMQRMALDEMGLLSIFDAQRIYKNPLWYARASRSGSAKFIKATSQGMARVYTRMYDRINKMDETRRPLYVKSLESWRTRIVNTWGLDHEKVD